MYRRKKGGGIRVDTNRITLVKLQTLKDRLLSILSRFLKKEITRCQAIQLIEELQTEANEIALKYAITVNTNT